jgi:hypothetical protein
MKFQMAKLKTQIKEVITNNKVQSPKETKVVLAFKHLDFV